MDDTSFLEAISDSAARGWIVQRPRRGPWIGARRRGSLPPRAGWKLHVSATTQSAVEVLGRVLPILVDEGVAFKVAATPSVVAALNEGEGGLSQIGKFITIYPRNDAQALKLAALLHDATVGLRGPHVSTDRELRPGSLVHYRYGAFSGPGDEEPPTPTTDPFIASGVAIVHRSRAIGGRYVAISTLHRSASGSVLVAADIEAGASCVLKRAGKDARVDANGRDAQDRLRHEASILDELSSDPRIPAVHQLVEDGNDLYLVMDQILGSTLGSIVAGPCEMERTIAWGRQLASILQAVHDAGIVYRDLNPLNVLVDLNGSIRLVDFELAYATGSVGIAAGTPGYCSLEQAGGAPASVSDDVYGLGAMLWFLFTGADPDVEAIGPSGSDLHDVIVRCLDRDPDRRWASISDVDSALEHLQAAL